MFSRSRNNREAKDSLELPPVSKDVPGDVYGTEDLSDVARWRQVEVIPWFLQFAGRTQWISNLDSPLWHRNKCINHKNQLFSAVASSFQGGQKRYGVASVEPCPHERLHCMAIKVGFRIDCDGSRM